MWAELFPWQPSAVCKHRKTFLLHLQVDLLPLSSTNPDLGTGSWPTSLPVCFPVSNMAAVTQQEVGVRPSSPSCLTEAK